MYNFGLSECNRVKPEVHNVCASMSRPHKAVDSVSEGPEVPGSIPSLLTYLDGN